MPAGTIVASGSLVSPGGQQGIPGPNAVSTDAGNQATFGSDSRIYVPDPTPVITSVRLRSFNAIGNPSFEVDQINCGATVASANAKIVDRWRVSVGGTMVVSAGQRPAASVSDIVIPGTSFQISRSFFRITLTTTQASLGASDWLYMYQLIEGPQWRELANDVHSVSLLVRSSVGGLKFGLTLRDSNNTINLSKLCTISSANIWVLLPLANLPIWPSSGNPFVSTPGLISYSVALTLAAGTSLTTPANDTWQASGNLLGAVGQDNFASKPVNSTFDIAFVQHEPGALCTTLIDCPFGVNLDGPMGCLRYYQKTYNYGDAIGSTNAQGAQFLPQITTTLLGGQKWLKPMAKVPTSATIYHHTTGVVNSFQHVNSTTYSYTGMTGLGASGFLAANTSTMPAPAAGAGGYVQYVLDTGW